MGSKICMNGACGATTTLEWKTGWGLRSGEFANLCSNCGSAYENLVFCDTFHLEDSGWRECNLCSKRLHCGCIASKSFLELLEYGGVGCISCAKTAGLHVIPSDEIPPEIGTSTTDIIGDPQSTFVETRMDGNCVDKGKLMQLNKAMEINELNHLHHSWKGETNVSIGQIKREEAMHPIGDVCIGFPNLTQPSVGSSEFAKLDNTRRTLGVKGMHESLGQPSLSITLSAPSGTPNFVLPFPGGVVEGRERSKAPPFQQGQRTRRILPKPLKTGLTIGSEANIGMVPQMRVARPPAEGRGRNQLLPRYWPRITDQELQQLSGDLNSTIVPLFEKVLSASDAGRIGRLVLPKACAEAYFPHISQSEGLPLRIQDAKGKEWTFQFRFWPNNNSRMYVLEGVTPCIQSMQLQAGDTVTFSRIDPGGKLVMGFRKASNSVDMQDAQTSALPNGAVSGETSISDVIENLPTVSGYSVIFQSLKGSKDPHIKDVSKHLNFVDGDIAWHKIMKHGGRTNEDSFQQPILLPEKKRTRNIGSKSKRLLMHSDDVLELRLTWEEAQDLLRPPPSVKPSIVTIEDYEFEEYDEPPVFGKRTIFTARPSGGQEQWARCDNCSKWRRLPEDVLLPPKWRCSDNVWDSSRCSCSAPDEMSPQELENLFRVNKDFKKRRITGSQKLAQKREPSGLDALATAAVLGDNVGDSGEPSVGATTKHPRHRPGCTCIVCIQPPSGKGKHKPTCTCNVCMTVKRRFKTLMMRKKNRQTEREAEIAERKHHVHPKDESELKDTSRHALLHTNHSENERSQSKIQAEMAETSKGQLDLNCHPNREDDLQVEETGASMMSLVQAASLPLQMYLQQNGLTSLIHEQEASLGSCLLPQTTGESEGRVPDEGYLASVVWEHQKRGDEGDSEPNLD